MENKVYIVTEGEYSDYGIEAVFSTKEKANEYVQQHGSDCRIEEYDIDQEVKRESKIWRIAINLENNEVLSVKPEFGFLPKDDGRCSVYDTFNDEKHMEFYVDAESMDKAKRIACERLVAIKSNDYIYLRMTRPYKRDWRNYYESFNVKTNEFEESL